MTRYALPSTTPQMPTDIWWMRAAVRGLAWLLFVLTVVAALIWLGRLPMFQMATLRLDGEMEHNNVPTVKASMTPYLQGQQQRFFSVDLMEGRRVLESLPWVRQARLRRVWPNELRATLQEHHPVALWQSSDREDQMVNSFGEVFEANTGEVDEQSLPTFRAPAHASSQDAAEMLQMYQQLQAVMLALDSQISVLRLNERGSWAVTLASDAEIELGRGTPAEVMARTRRFVRTVVKFAQRTQQSLPGALLYADLRYPSGYAVRMRGLTTAQPSDASLNSYP
jgi:cell division protein FtsQ